MGYPLCPELDGDTPYSRLDGTGTGYAAGDTPLAVSLSSTSLFVLFWQNFKKNKSQVRLCTCTSKLVRQLQLQCCPPIGQQVLHWRWIWGITAVNEAYYGWTLRRRNGGIPPCSLYNGGNGTIEHTMAEHWSTDRYRCIVVCNVLFRIVETFCFTLISFTCDVRKSGYNKYLVVGSTCPRFVPLKDHWPNLILRI